MTTNTNEFRYRPDIDGLRAIAVLLVILFHSDLGFTGGFIGVDVFFVISGYLITGLILNQQASNRFSLVEFWIRRIRRIIPAVTVMVIAVMSAGYFLLLPIDYEELASSALAQQLLLSNVFFWRNTQYFAGPAELKPLLHTWSLAVEEQFYLGYPFLLMLLHRRSSRLKLGVLIFLTIGSLIISQLGLTYNRSASFYLLPSRAWEMLLGALICFVRVPPKISYYVLELISWSSITTIVLCAWFYHSATPFPGICAVLPCLATALLICSNSAELMSAGRLLATKPLVSIGLVSYSLYLWHWPILSFARYWSESELGLAKTAILLVIIAVAATISYCFVEQPLRRSSSSAYKTIIFSGICSLPIISVAIACLIYLNQGFKHRVPELSLRYHLATESKSFVDVSIGLARAGLFPQFGIKNSSRKCLLWGDSHAMALAPGLEAACLTSGYAAYQATASNTPPVIGFVPPRGYRQRAPQFNKAVLEFINQQKIDTVILGGNWSGYTDDPSFEHHFTDTISALLEHNLKIVIMLDVATQEVDPPFYLAKKIWQGETAFVSGTSAVNHGEKNREFIRIVSKLKSDTNVVIIDPKSNFIDTEGNWQYLIGNQIMYCDDGHISIEGSLRLAVQFEAILKTSQ